MPFAAITYDIKAGCEKEIEEIFANFRRVGSAAVPSRERAAGPSRIITTALFIRDDTMVRFIEYEGDLETVAWHMANQPGVLEVERKLKPYLSKPRHTDTPEGFVRTFTSSLLRCISALTIRDAAPVAS